MRGGVAGECRSPAKAEFPFPTFFALESVFVPTYFLYSNPFYLTARGEEELSDVMVKNCWP